MIDNQLREKVKNVLQIIKIFKSAVEKTADLLYFTIFSGYDKD